jgi:hypothetical protein
MNSYEGENRMDLTVIIMDWFGTDYTTWWAGSFLSAVFLI